MAVEPGPRGWFLEFLVFGFKQGWACLFGGLMLALLLGTHLFWPDDAPLPRYDAITIGAVLIQLGMLAFRLETPNRHAQPCLNPKTRNSRNQPRGPGSTAIASSRARTA